MIARVFPRKTSMSPTGKDVYFRGPRILWDNIYEEVHISCTFTWDIKRAKELKQLWKNVCSNVKIGGPAFGDPGSEFISNFYLKEGITITSRGCPNHCNHCFVPEREGEIRELKIQPGNTIQDNNLLACSPPHVRKVFQMLKSQKHIDFKGGLELSKLTDKIIDDLRGLNIYQLWIAYDFLGIEKLLSLKIEKLRKYFSRNQVRCYVLIGMKGDSFEKAEGRLKEVFQMGALPFAMRFRSPSENWNNTFLFKDRKWNLLARSWSRPAAMKFIMKNYETSNDR